MTLDRKTGIDLDVKRKVYGVLDVKAVTEDENYFWIEGIATTPSVDRQDDIVEPMGAQFETPMPLLWQHESDKPIGQVMTATRQKAGIPYTARIPKVKEAGVLKDRLDEAIQSIRHKLVAAVSIGFKPMADEIEVLKSGGYRFLKWIWLELSVVTIPAQPEATITGFKSFDASLRALAREKHDAQESRSTSGTQGSSVRVVHIDTPSKPGPQDRRNNAMPTIQENISSYEAKRAANVARTEALVQLSTDEGRTFQAEEKEEYSTLDSEIKEIDDHLVILRRQQEIAKKAAKPVTGHDGNGDAGSTPAAPRKSSVIELKDTPLPPGIGFARYVMCMHQAKGNPQMAAMLAKSRGYADSSPAVASVLNAMAQGLDVKAAVAGGNVQDANWASPLVQYTNLASEFVSFLRPLTIFGRLQGLRHVPFMTKIPRQTAGASGYWVGEQQGKPLSKLQFDSITMPPTKMATIVVISDELARLSNPSAETLVRDDLAAALAQFQDQQAFSPGVAGVANTNPASLTYGLTAVSSAATGGSAATIANVYTDTKAAVDVLVAANISPESAVWLLDPATALGIGTIQTTIGTPAFPDIGVTGGTLLGLPVIVSNNVVHTTSGGSVMVLISPTNVIVADDGGVTIDISSEASLQMSDAPTASAASLVSMFQTNQIAIRAEQYINYAARRTGAVAYIDGAHYA